MNKLYIKYGLTLIFWRHGWCDTGWIFSLDRHTYYLYQVEIASGFLDDYFSPISKNHDFLCLHHTPIVLTSTTTKSISPDCRFFVTLNKGSCCMKYGSTTSFNWQDKLKMLNICSSCILLLLSYCILTAC